MRQRNRRRPPPAAANDARYMHGWVTFLSALVLATAAGSVEARIPRSSSAVTAFKRANPCPINSARRGPCPGYEVDHIEPLCAGGPDTPENMQWLTRAQHREKTRRDVMHCRLGARQGR